jgi:hypothetical protein
MFHSYRRTAASLLLAGSQLAVAQSYFAGTVVDANNQPIVGATVQAGQMTGFQTPFQMDGQATTDAQGHYAITTLAAGDGSGKYVLVARLQGRVPMVYPNKPCSSNFPCPSPVPFPSTVAVPNLAIDFQLLNAASISGHVSRTDTNGPVVGTTVFLDSNSLHPYSISTVTDSAGNFQFRGLFPDHYQLDTHFSQVPNQDNLLPQVYAAHDYDVVSPQATGDDVILSDGQDATGIDFALHPGGIILGQVNSTFSGHLVSVPIGIRRLTPTPSGTGFTSAGTSGRFAPMQIYASAPGWYGIGPLLPGTFAIRFGGGAFSTEYYQHAPTEAQALPVTVGAGQGVANIDGLVGSYQAISGHITDAATGNPVVNAIVHGGPALPGFPTLLDVTDTLTDSLGAYTLEGLSPGANYIWVTRNSDYLDQTYPDVLGCCFQTTGTQSIQLAQGQYVLGVDMALTRGASLAGHVYDPGTGADAANLTLWLVDANGHSTGSGTTNSGGSFLSSTVPTGNYYVCAITQNGYYYYPAYFCPFTATCDLSNAQALIFSAPQHYWLDFPIAHLDRVFQSAFE